MGESTTPTDDERMRAALELATGHPSPAARAMAGAARPFTPRWTHVAAGAAAVVLLVSGRSDRREPAGVASVPGWREALSWVFVIVAVLGVVGLVVAFLRSGAMRRFRTSPLHVLTRHQRDQLRLQIDGEEAVVVDELPLTRMMVTDRLRAVPYFWWWIPVISVFIAVALRSDGHMRWLYTALMILLAVRTVVRHRTRVRRLRTFLELHTPTTTPEATP